VNWLPLIALPLIVWSGVPKLAVLPLSVQGVDDSEAASIAQAISDGLQNTRATTVRPRSEVDALLGKDPACSTPACARHAGTRLAAEEVVYGTVSKDGNGRTLFLQRIEVDGGDVLFRSSRGSRDALDLFLRDIVPGVVADLSGTSDLPPRTGRVTEAHVHSVSLDIGPDAFSHGGDRLRLLSPAGEDDGWVRVTDRADDFALGGPGQATIISGDPEVGQRLEKIPLMPLALEFRAGWGTDIQTWDYGETDGYKGKPSLISSIADLSATAWLRTGNSFDLWLGLGFLVDVEKNTSEIATTSASFPYYDASVQYKPTTSRILAEPGFQATLRKGLTIHRRVGCFLQGAGAVFPGSEVGLFHLDLTGGIFVDLAPGLSLQSTAGAQQWIMNANANGGVWRFVSGLSLVWIPPGN
jgi:hypothetical protein